jgi:hypothetical protein
VCKVVSCKIQGRKLPGFSWENSRLVKMQNKYGLFLRMFDALSSNERELQILSKTDKFALVFRLSAQSSIHVNNKTITGAILVLPVLKDIAVILTSEEEDTDGDN